MKTAPAKNVDEYIAAFPLETRQHMESIRNAIKEVAPLAEESISYGMPMFSQKGMLVYFGGYAKHIGLYPGAAAISAFKDDIAQFKNAKGSVQFPLNKPMPLELIKHIVTYRLQQLAAKP